MMVLVDDVAVEHGDVAAASAYGEHASNRSDSDVGFGISGDVDCGVGEAALYVFPAGWTRKTIYPPLTQERPKLFSFGRVNWLARLRDLGHRSIVGRR